MLNASYRLDALMTHNLLPLVFCHTENGFRSQGADLGFISRFFDNALEGLV